MTMLTPYLLLTAGFLAMLTITILIWKNRRLGLGLGLLCTGMILLAAAAGSPQINRPHQGKIHVLVDLSGSTRIADYCNWATLQKMIHQAIGDREYQLTALGNGITLQSVQPTSGYLLELPNRGPDLSWPSTVSDDAVILLSDGRFTPPAISTPVYVIKDKSLAQVKDNAVLKLLRLNKTAVSVTVRVAKEGMRLRLSQPGSDAVDRLVPVGISTVTMPVPDLRQPVKVSLIPAILTELEDRALEDIWPENDAMALGPPADHSLSRLLISRRNAPDGWIQRTPESLLERQNRWGDYSVIVLDEMPADAMQLEPDLFREYVQIMGGQLIVIQHQVPADQTRARSPSGSAGWELSPLSMQSPMPGMHWAILLDASGSMNQPTAGSTRWQLEQDAMMSMVAALPKENILSIGSFTSEANWWIKDQTREQILGNEQGLRSQAAQGTTHIASALDAFIAIPSNTTTIPTTRPDQSPRLTALLMTDGQDTLENAPDFARRLNEKKIRLNVLLLGDGPAGAALEQIAQSTGGELSRSFQPQRWAADASSMIHRLDAGRTIVQSAHMQMLPSPGFTDLNPIFPTDVTSWQQSWLKDKATLLAELSPSQSPTEHLPGQKWPAAAIWQRGLGRVMAITWPASTENLDALGRWMERAPGDSRFSVEIGSYRAIIVNAINSDGTFINTLKMMASWVPNNGPTYKSLSGPPVPQTAPLLQTAPGRYELPAGALVNCRWEQPQTIELQIGGQSIGVYEMPARYPPELETLGTDDKVLDDLARKTGGAVIDLDHPQTIGQSHLPADLTRWFLLAGAGLSLLGLGWQMRTRQKSAAA